MTRNTDEATCRATSCLMFGFPITGGFSVQSQGPDDAAPANMKMVSPSFHQVAVWGTVSL